jgi:outer membrane translocation and assembly module TamA
VLFGSFNPRLVVAGRVGGGWIVPYGSGPEASVPYRERLYLGGANTVRGWGEKRLGPSVTYTDTETKETTEQPAGGLLSVYGNLELRKSLFGNFGLTLFTDVGRVWDSPSNFNFSGLQWSVGGGPRYKSAIGTVHVDVGVRLGEDAIFASQPRVAWHFGLSEAF